jgi:hypothetical protein
MLDTPNNRARVETLVAIMRSQIRAPGFNPQHAIDLALTIDSLMRSTGHTTGECTVAACCLVLRGIGAADPFNLDRARQV